MKKSNPIHNYLYDVIEEQNKDNLLFFIEIICDCDKYYLKRLNKMYDDGNNQKTHKYACKLYDKSMKYHNNMNDLMEMIGGNVADLENLRKVIDNYNQYKSKTKDPQLGSTLENFFKERELKNGVDKQYIKTFYDGITLETKPLNKLVQVFSRFSRGDNRTHYIMTDIINGIINGINKEIFRRKRDDPMNKMIAKDKKTPKQIAELRKQFQQRSDLSDEEKSIGDKTGNKTVQVKKSQVPPPPPQQQQQRPAIIRPIKLPPQKFKTIEVPVDTKPTLIRDETIKSAEDITKMPLPGDIEPEDIESLLQKQEDKQLFEDVDEIIAEDELKKEEALKKVEELEKEKMMLNSQIKLLKEEQKKIEDDYELLELTNNKLNRNLANQSQQKQQDELGYIEKQKELEEKDVINMAKITEHENKITELNDEISKLTNELNILKLFKNTLSTKIDAIVTDENLDITATSDEIEKYKEDKKSDLVYESILSKEHMALINKNFDKLKKYSKKNEELMNQIFSSLSNNIERRKETMKDLVDLKN